ncbi:MAG: hypothetical protein ACREAD_02180 [Nitrosopumilaceae archaeon]
MSQTVWTDRKIMLFSFVTAGTSVVAGILHLTMVSQSISHNLGQGILFLVGGVLQVFWAVPVIKRWGRVWQIIGIVGTTVFVILFYLSRFHLIPEGNILGGESAENIPRGEFPRNMTGSELTRGPPPGGMRIGFERIVPPIEMCQIAFIGLYIVLGKVYSARQKNI